MVCLACNVVFKKCTVQSHEISTLNFLSLWPQLGKKNIRKQFCILAFLAPWCFALTDYTRIGDAGVSDNRDATYENSKNLFFIFILKKVNKNTQEKTYEKSELWGSWLNHCTCTEVLNWYQACISQWKNLERNLFLSDVFQCVSDRSHVHKHFCPRMVNVQQMGFVKTEVEILLRLHLSACYQCLESGSGKRANT